LPSCSNDVMNNIKIAHPDKTGKLSGFSWVMPVAPHS
jgi:hypothetical protein